MVSLAAGTSIMILAFATLAVEADAGAGKAVRSVLTRGKFPWYDAKTDAAKPLWPMGMGLDNWFTRYFGWLKYLRLPRLGKLLLGDLFVIGIVLLAATLFLVLLLEAWRRYRPMLPGVEQAQTPFLERRSAIEGLPAGIPSNVTDPWAEAVHLRARGDYTGAVVYLFAHQLLTLDRLRLLRLVPGKTGRQLVQAIGDRQFRAWVEPCLRLFEAAYYGHHAPTAEDFEVVWSLANAFEHKVAERGVS